MTLFMVWWQPFACIQYIIAFMYCIFYVFLAASFGHKWPYDWPSVVWDCETPDSAVWQHGDTELWVSFPGITWWYFYICILERKKYEAIPLLTALLSTLLLGLLCTDGMCLIIIMHTQPSFCIRIDKLKIIMLF